MYVTVTANSTRWLVVYGPRPGPAVSLVGTAVTVPVCPVAAVDRTNGVLTHPYRYRAAGPVIAGCLPRPPAAGTVGDLNAETVAVCVHPVSHRMFVVGPFTGPDRAEHWWHARINRFADVGVRCHVLPLNPPPSTDGNGPASEIDRIAEDGGNR
jgi:hypothetical protein